MNVVTEGVYFLYDGDELVYIGESDNLYRRIGQHIAEGKKKFDRFSIYETIDRKRLEGFLIDALKPKYNISRGANYDFHMDDIFPTASIMETIQRYEENQKDYRVKDAAEDLGFYSGPLIRVLVEHDAPIYKIDGTWRVDREWFVCHKGDICAWYCEI